MKTAFIIVGPASSCTRMVKRLLINAGCFGDDTNRQQLDKFVDGNKPLPENDLIVFHRSFPHGVYYRGLMPIEQKFKSNGVNTKWIVVLRDWIPTLRSKIKRHHQPHIDNAVKALRSEIYSIFGEMRRFQPNFYIVNTSNLKQSIKGLEAFCELKLNAEIIRDEDSKHYENIPAMAW